jgi:GNAT superfamily N-acetyltransferase
MPESLTFSLRLMKPDDLGQAFSLSMAEGWNQTSDDWQFLLQNPANICLVAEKDNRVAGTATALVHDHKVAWIGMVLVDKSLRGHGAGKLLMEDLILRLSGTESVKLDATPAGEPLYARLGFKPEYKIFRMTCIGLKPLSGNQQRENISNIDKNQIREITRFDSAIFGVSRTELIHYLVFKYPEMAFCQAGEYGINGFVLGRKGSRFTYLGPAEAMSSQLAIQLISAALERQTGQSIALDIPEDKHDVIEWLESVGFIKQRHFTRMYLNVNPYPGITGRQHLISGPEFG